MGVLLIRGELSIVLTIAPANFTYHQHVRIIKMTGLRMGCFPLLAKTYTTHTFPGVLNVACGAPAIATYFTRPVPAIAHSILAKAKKDIAVNFIQ